MFKDINLSINNNKIDYEYKIINDEILINTISELEIGNSLKIFYDENIYDIKLSKNINFHNGNSGEIIIDFDSTNISFSVKLKNNFFVKSVYKYINKLINIEDLINEINLFINSNIIKKYNDDLSDLLNKIENKDKSLEDLIINKEDEYERIFQLLVNNKTYLDIAENMNDLELMLLITSYIYVPYIPKIDQESFNDLIKAAKNYDNDLENIWRLGMNFDGRGYNFDLLDNFFVKSKNIWYLGEYISGIHQVNQEKIVNKIIETNDKNFIQQVLKNNLIIDNLDEKYKNILESAI